MDVEKLEQRCETFVQEAYARDTDPAHDVEHVRRVVANARRLAAAEGGDWLVVAPAAWLHDCVVVPKDSAERSEASALAAERAAEFLQNEGYPTARIPAVRHAIAAHSYSAGNEPETLEARVVQDADRLDALGAIGVARCLMLGGAMDLPLYYAEEPFPRTRTPDDSTNVLDHFYVKLLHLAGAMKTRAGREEAQRRTRFMRDFLQQLEREICS